MEEEHLREEMRKRHERLATDHATAKMRLGVAEKALRAIHAGGWSPMTRLEWADYPTNLVLHWSRPSAILIVGSDLRVCFRTRGEQMETMDPKELEDFARLHLKTALA
jgi:hypothetical protein